MTFVRSLSLAFLAFAVAYTPAHASKSDASTYELLNLFGDVFERVREDYVEEAEDQELIESAINGMLTALDPHSGYLSAKSFEEMQVQTKGEFGGLGIEVTMENGLVKVVSPIDETPAYEAGIQPGDFISQLDGEPVLGLTLSEAVDKMRGRVGTEIVITILREGESEPFDVTIERDTIKIRSVRTRKEGEDVAYLRIVSFSENTYSSMKDQFDDMKDEMGDNLKGIVLDLRNNPGGLLDQAISVSDAFLEQGEIVSTRERDPQDTKRYAARSGDLAKGLPIVVLINQGSASASEIVAGALKDHKRAVVMGSKSFGKGSVQTVIPLKNHGAMRLTTARYYTPSGTSIQATGIIPDIKVDPARIEKIDTSKVRSESSLRGHLSNEQEKRKAKQEEEKRKKALKAGGPVKSEEAEKDYQLSRAIDLIRALAVYKQVVAE